MSKKAIKLPEKIEMISPMSENIKGMDLLPDVGNLICIVNNLIDYLNYKDKK